MKTQIEKQRIINTRSDVDLHLHKKGFGLY